MQGEKGERQEIDDKNENSSTSGSRKRTIEEEERAERNRQRALDLLNSRVVPSGSQKTIVKKGAPITHSRPIDTGGGFFIDPPTLSQSQGVIHFEKSEEETDQSDDDEFGEGQKRKKKRRKKPPPKSSPEKEKHVLSQPVPEENLLVPRPPDEVKPVCDECSRTFDDSFLLANFDCQVCDACRDPKGIHTLITRTTAKDRYLLSDVDLDIREPPLRRIFKKNPRNSTWGDMQLFLEAQVAARSLEIWGSEENVEAERTNRTLRREKAKERGFQKKVKELRLQVRSSLYTRKADVHEHTFGPEIYDEATDTHSKSCTTCGQTMTYEKM